MPADFFVYIMTNQRHSVLYTGVTNNLIRRVAQHRAGRQQKDFTCRYRVTKLIYFEQFRDAYNAITREKQIEGGSRQDKIDLINSRNSAWIDLAENSL
jgi:putative endonuclease